jgi:hypothetical protein
MGIEAHVIDDVHECFPITGFAHREHKRSMTAC